MEINDLPPEIVNMILKYTSYYISKLVCKYWKDVIGNKKNGIIGISNINLHNEFVKSPHYNETNVIIEGLLENNNVLIDYFQKYLNAKSINSTTWIGFFKRKNDSNFNIMNFYNLDPSEISKIIESNISFSSIKWLSEKYPHAGMLDETIMSKNITNSEYLLYKYVINSHKCFINLIKDKNIRMFELIDNVNIYKHSDWFYKKCIHHNFVEGIRILTQQYDLYPSQHIIYKIFRGDNHELLSKMINIIDFISEDLNYAVDRRAIKCVKLLLKQGIQPDNKFIERLITLLEIIELERKHTRFDKMPKKRYQEFNNFIREMLEKYGYLDMKNIIIYYINVNNIKYLRNHHNQQYKVSYGYIKDTKEDTMIYCIENNIILLDIERY